MKKFLILFLLSLISLHGARGHSIDSLLRVYDATLVNRHLYEGKKSDSLAAPFASVRQFIGSGFIEDAANMLEGIRLSELSTEERMDYFRCRILQYDYWYRMHRSDTLGYKYMERVGGYLDSLSVLLPTGSAEKMYCEAISFLRRHEYKNAYRWLEQAEQATDEPQLLMAVYEKMAEIDGRLGNDERADCHLVRRAVCGIKHAVDDYSGLMDVAAIQLRRGETEKARSSLDCAQHAALSNPSPLLAAKLNRAWMDLSKSDLERRVTERHRLYFFFSVLSVMAVLLLFSIRKINRQMQVITQGKEKVEELYADLEKKNDALEKVNAGLTDLTEKLQVTNAQLSEVSLLKEEYIGHFLKQCSEYLHKLQDYKKMVNRKIQAGQIEELFKQNSSNRMAQEESKELYRKFDIAFLKIFPHFVEQFNELLTPDERFVLDKNELLNTELRLFALIRLGIKDSSQIADFLGYSVTTIYTYRTRIKNKAMGNRDEFEANVMKIGM